MRRLSFARVCVEIRADQPRLESVVVVLEGGEERVVEVEYEWAPVTCTTCGVFGHKCKTAQGPDEVGSRVAQPAVGIPAVGPIAQNLPDTFLDGSPLAHAEREHQPSRDSATVGAGQQVPPEEPWTTVHRGQKHASHKQPTVAQNGEQHPTPLGPLVESPPLQALVQTVVDSPTLAQQNAELAPLRKPNASKNSSKQPNASKNDAQHHKPALGPLLVSLPVQPPVQPLGDTLAQQIDTPAHPRKTAGSGRRQNVIEVPQKSQKQTPRVAVSALKARPSTNSSKLPVVQFLEAANNSREGSPHPSWSSGPSDEEGVSDIGGEEGSLSPPPATRGSRRNIPVSASPSPERVPDSQVAMGSPSPSGQLKNAEIIIPYAPPPKSSKRGGGRNR